MRLKSETIKHEEESKKRKQIKNKVKGITYIYFLKQNGPANKL